MTDGRTLIGQFLCTDRDCNIILGSCYEYAPYASNKIYFIDRVSSTLLHLLVFPIRKYSGGSPSFGAGYGAWETHNINCY